MRALLVLTLLCALSFHAENLSAMSPQTNKKAGLTVKQKNHHSDRQRDPKDIENLIHRELQQAFSSNMPGASVLVMKEGKILFQRAYGLANVELKHALTTQHRFHTASIGKQFTAAAILRLSEQGQLKLDEPVKSFLDSIPASWSNITIKHCLTHTSGIYNLFEDEKFRANAFNLKTPSQLLEYAIANPLGAVPGERFSYATVNYSLLAMIVEKLSGRSFETYIQQEFLQKLGMKNTIYDQQAGVIEGAVTPYEAGPKLAARFHPSVGFGGGNFYSTTEDLAKWTGAMQSGRVLNAENTQAMHSQFKLNNGTSVAYGYGTRPHRLGDETYLQSNGDIPGYHGETVYLPKSKIYVAILSNGEQLPYGLAPIAKRLAVIASGKSIEAVKSVKLASPDLEKFAGIYQQGQDQYAFHVKGDKLYFEAPLGAQWKALSAKSATEFFYDSNTDFRIRFIEKDGGKHLAQWFEVYPLDGEFDPVFERVVLKSLF